MRDELRDRRSKIETFDELVSFLEYVKDECNYDYGVAPRSIAQASVAVAWYLASEFGITGFQAGFVMWDFIRDWNKKHNATYLLTSPSLFGDAKKHVIDLEIQGIEDKVKQTFVIEFSIFVDGIEQEVFYPHFWEGLYPKGHAFRPYFILNVDKL